MSCIDSKSGDLLPRTLYTFTRHSSQFFYPFFLINKCACAIKEWLVASCQTYPPLHDLWSTSVFVVLLNIVGTDTSSPYHCPWKREWRHCIGRKAGCHSCDLSECTYRFSSHWVIQIAVDMENTHISQHHHQLSVFWRINSGISGVNSDVVVSGKTTFSLWNLGPQSFQNRISASHNCRMIEFVSTLILKACLKRKRPCWYLNLILSMDYRSLPWTCDFALPIISEVMFLFEKIAVCTEVKKILPKRHLSTSETQLGPRLSSKHLLISYSPRLKSTLFLSS